MLIRACIQFLGTFVSHFAWMILRVCVAAFSFFKRSTSPKSEIQGNPSLGATAQQNKASIAKTITQFEALTPETTPILQKPATTELERKTFITLRDTILKEAYSAQTILSAIEQEAQYSQTITIKKRIELTLTFQRLSNSLEIFSKLFASHTKNCFKDLTDVHTTRYAKRV